MSSANAWLRGIAPGFVTTDVGTCVCFHVCLPVVSHRISSVESSRSVVSSELVLGILMRLSLTAALTYRTAALDAVLCGDRCVMAVAITLSPNPRHATRPMQRRTWTNKVKECHAPRRGAMTGAARRSSYLWLLRAPLPLAALLAARETSERAAGARRGAGPAGRGGGGARADGTRRGPERSRSTVSTHVDENRTNRAPPMSMLPVADAGLVSFDHCFS